MDRVEHSVASTPYCVGVADTVVVCGRPDCAFGYYWYAWATLCRTGKINPTEPVNFSVPTGNFGDILAGYFAKCMGLPVGKLLCASNANNVLTEFLTTGRYDRRRPFYKTSSPSMDILVSSNLERLLYLASGGDAKMVAEKMQELDGQGWYQIGDTLLKKIQKVFLCGCCDDTMTSETIKTVWERDMLRNLAGLQGPDGAPSTSSTRSRC